MEPAVSTGIADFNDAAHESWRSCRFLTCSVLPVRVACNCVCRFCFSKSSISALKREWSDWERLPVDAYYEWARDHGATRLVITGGGEPLLRPDDVVRLVAIGRSFFDEIACFTNGTFLTSELAVRLQDAGLSYICYSRHHEDDTRCRELMGVQAPSLEDFFKVASGLTIRATCVMARGYVDDAEAVWHYVSVLRRYGVRQFTFKHTYVAYEYSMFQSSVENEWARTHQVEFDPFEGEGEVIGELPWGPQIRRIGDLQVCYYHEPSPIWERRNRLCRSSNLLSDGKVYASLEDQRSLLFQLKSS